jgi:hypothetical protein
LALSVRLAVIGQIDVHQRHPGCIAKPSAKAHAWAGAWVSNSIRLANGKGAAWQFQARQAKGGSTTQRSAHAAKASPAHHHCMRDKAGFWVWAARTKLTSAEGIWSKW